MNEDDAPAEEQQEAPPRRLTSQAGKPYYHPSCLRVGVRIDGRERNDIISYNQGALTYRTRNDPEGATERRALSIETYWRWPESRQERRARERYDLKHSAS